MSDFFLDVYEWMASQEAANLGQLLKGVGLCGIAIMAWIWLLQVSRWRRQPRRIDEY